MSPPSAGMSWSISCRDRVDRKRELILLVNDDLVMLVLPAGEVANLSLFSVTCLRRALETAISDR